MANLSLWPILATGMRTLIHPWRARKPCEFFRDKTDLAPGRTNPDGRCVDSRLSSPSNRSRMTGARKLNALTSLRFIAAAIIVMHHLRGFFGVSEHIGDPFILPQAVAFFF